MAAPPLAAPPVPVVASLVPWDDPLLHYLGMFWQAVLIALGLPHPEQAALTQNGIRYLTALRLLMPCALHHFEQLALVYLQPLLCSSQLLSTLACPLLTSR